MMTIHNLTTLLTHHGIGLEKKLMRNFKSKSDLKLQVFYIEKVNQIYFQMDSHSVYYVDVV